MPNSSMPAHLKIRYFRVSDINHSEKSEKDSCEEYVFHLTYNTINAKYWHATIYPYNTRSQNNNKDYELTLNHNKTQLDSININPVTHLFGEYSLISYTIDNIFLPNGELNLSILRSLQNSSEEEFSNKIFAKKWYDEVKAKFVSDLNWAIFFNRLYLIASILSFILATTILMMSLITLATPVFFICLVSSIFFMYLAQKPILSGLKSILNEKLSAQHYYDESQNISDTCEKENPVIMNSITHER